MKCICWDKYFSKIIFSLEHAQGDLPFEFDDYDKMRNAMQVMIDNIQKNWKCVEECWKLLGEFCGGYDDEEKKII